MEFYSILLIAVGLAMDAFAVSVSNGIGMRDVQFREALRIALFFGFFQAFMPVVGWLAGLSVRLLIAEYDHWIAFGLLSFVGGRMIYEAWDFDSFEERDHDPLRLSVLLMLAVATSIDALVVGFSLTFLGVYIIMPALIIGVVTFIMSLTGVYLGNRLGHVFENRLEILGGLILIGIGFRILYDHLLIW